MSNENLPSLDTLEKKRAKKRETQNRYNRKKRAQKEITTEYLETELLKKYQDPQTDDQEKKDYLKYMMEIWKNKHKVPQTQKEDVDLSAVFASSETPIHS